MERREMPMNKYTLLTAIWLSTATAFVGCGGTAANTQEEKLGVIANIPEASGICYSSLRDSLFVVGDNGIIVELTTNGQVLRDKSFKSLDNHDFEGIACDDKEGIISIAVEGSDNILILNQENLNIVREMNIERGGILVKDKEYGLEGIAIYDGTYYLSNQSFNPYPQEDPSIVFTLDDPTNNKPNIEAIYDHGYTDISGLTFYKGYLYMVSDSDNIMIQYDIATQSTLFSKQLAKFSVEGITFDTDNHIYFADDDNGRVFKYKTMDFGIGNQ